MEKSQESHPSEFYTSAVSRYGNFKDYYNFHPAENRIRYLPRYFNFVSRDQGKVVCLDIGCNAGELTHALHQHLIQNFKQLLKEDVKCQILAVDLDQDLITRATKANKNEDILFVCIDVLSENFQQVCNSFLEKHNRKKFDILFCFSVTMWIHINNGDETLKHFLVMLSEITDLLVLEPQPWKCYYRAVRRVARANTEPFAEYSGLQIRKEIEYFINDFLVENCNFTRILQSEPTKWQRLISVYKLKQNV